MSIILSQAGSALGAVARCGITWTRSVGTFLMQVVLRHRRIATEPAAGRCGLREVLHRGGVAD